MEHSPALQDRDGDLPEHYNMPLYPDNSFKYASTSEGYKNDPKEQDGTTKGREIYRLPFGWTPLVFGVVIAAVTALVVGGVVGGGVGGSLGASSSGCSTKTVTVTSVSSSPRSTVSAVTYTPTASSTSSALATNYSVFPYNAISSLALDCPALDGKIYKAQQSGQDYQLHCEEEYTADDIAQVFAYSWQDCVEGCASMNYAGSANGSVTCQHAYFSATLDEAVYEFHRNCFLKGNDSVVPTSVVTGGVLTADLVTS